MATTDTKQAGEALDRARRVWGAAQLLKGDPPPPGFTPAPPAAPALAMRVDDQEEALRVAAA